jgi:hypothetical protein
MPCQVRGRDSGLGQAASSSRPYPVPGVPDVPVSARRHVGDGARHRIEQVVRPEPSPPRSLADAQRHAIVGAIEHAQQPDESFSPSPHSIPSACVLVDSAAGPISIGASLIATTGEGSIPLRTSCRHLSNSDRLGAEHLRAKVEHDLRRCTSMSIGHDEFVVDDDWPVIESRLILHQPRRCDGDAEVPKFVHEPLSVSRGREDLQFH